MVSYHLIVLVHGLWGHHTNMDYIQKQIEEHIRPDPQSNEEIIVLKTGSHSGFLTYDGIDVNGKRVADEINEKTNELNVEKNTVAKISVIGYSLGGLIARYAIGILHFQEFFEKVEPVNFVTFCSPHVGVLTPGTSITVRLFNLVVPYLLAHSGSQMFLADEKYIDVKITDVNDEEQTGNSKGLPLLVWMADPSSMFFKALSSFKYKALYANIINDKRTCWFTSAISIMDPFKSMSNHNSSIYDLDYIKGYEPTVIDLDKPIILSKVTPKSSEDPTVTEINWLLNWVQRKLNWLRFIGTLIIYTPLWGCYFIMKSVFERVKLNRRVNSFFQDTSNNMVHLYSLVGDEAIAFANDSVLVDADQDSEDLTKVNSKSKKITEISGDDSDEEDGDEGEDKYSSETASLRSHQSTGSFSTPFTNKLSEQTDGLIESVFDAMNSEDYKDYEYAVSSKANRTQRIDTDSFIVTHSEDTLMELPVSDSQKEIVSNLNTLNWKKFPVLIRNTKSTHAAAIVKVEDPLYDEGKLVIKHFINEVFKTS